MSGPGEVAVLQRFHEKNHLISQISGRDDQEVALNGSVHCMYPSINGPVGSSASSLAAHQSSISGKPPDFLNFNSSSYPSRSQGSSSGIANLFTQSHDLQPRSEYRNDVIQMPPGVSIGSGSKPPGLPGGNVVGGVSKVVGGGSGPGMLNENEFPSLITRPPPSFPTTSGGYYPSPPTPVQNPLAGSLNTPANSQQRSAYANYVRQQGSVESQQQEFRISTEDFPALPGAPQNDTQATQGHTNNHPGSSGEEGREERFNLPQPQGQKKGIQTQPDGTVKDIPAGMLSDQYGMAGLLTFLRAIESDPGIVALALGHDLTTLGLNLNAPERNLYQNFGGPWADHPCRPQDIDFHVPDEYMTNVQVREKLPPIKLNRFQEDLLFYLFYNFPGDVLQMASAAELYSRDWRYHKEEKVWLTRGLNPPVEQTGTYERGTYNLFDPNHWRKIPKEMHLDYTKLEERPQLPPQLQPSAGSGGSGGGSGPQQPQSLSTGPHNAQNS